MNTVLHCAVMLVLVLLAVPGYAAERLVLYDDFNATQINPNWWFGGEFGTTFPRWSTEAIRQIQDHKLRLMYHSYGSTNAAIGTSRNDFVLMFGHPAALTSMQAAVTVTAAVATGCPGSPDSTISRAALGGRFFGGAASIPDGGCGLGARPRGGRSSGAGSGYAPRTRARHSAGSVHEAPSPSAGAARFPTRR